MILITGFCQRLRAYAWSSFPSGAIDIRTGQHNITGMMIVAELQKTLARRGDLTAGM